MLEKLIDIPCKENIIYIDESNSCNIVSVIYKKKGIKHVVMEAKVQKIFGESIKPGTRSLFQSIE